MLAVVNRFTVSRSAISRRYFNSSFVISNDFAIAALLSAVSQVLAAVFASFPPASPPSAAPDVLPGVTLLL